MAFWPVLPWVLLVGGGALAYVRVLPPLGGFILSMLALPTAIAVALGLGWLRLRGEPLPHFTVLFFASILPAILLIFTGRDATHYPRINDVSTDLARPPEFKAVAALPENSRRNLDFPTAFVNNIHEFYSDLKPLVWPNERVDADAVFDAVVDVVEGEDRVTVLRADRNARELEAVAESLIFRFNDYIAARVTTQPGKVSLDLRSKSRDGKSDLGVNAKRIRALRAAVNTQIARIAPATKD
jgi:uncharacterized protein (DUF1499 family)